MDKKYIADKRNKSKKYKNSKYSKREETTETSNYTGNNHKTQQQVIDEDVIPNNWSRYESKNDDDKFIPGEGADYERLLLAPVGIDSHFKFKSEQNWDQDIKSQTELSKYFTLNIALLNEGISCVPFIKRQGYDESIISPLELEITKSTSASNLKKYKQTLLRKFPPNSDIIITKTSDTLKPELAKDISKTPTNIKSNNDIIPEVKVLQTKAETLMPQEDDIDDLLNFKCADLVINDESDNIKVEDPLLEKTEISKVMAPQPAVDLEQWLDDILDD